ncbi:unnamed protein product [Pleuronectes platessa]|uniref:Uncharacterized protein n=1 Tax=Pleuronectes platessa TaxID=8262 RepID=A0A9N7VH50_PLEPL|nr:unnamed protein product [Pleuronectes platessa]
MRLSQALQQCNALTHSSPHSLQRIVITVFEHNSAPGALPGLSSPGQCSFTAPQAAFECDTKAHSHPSPEPGTLSSQQIRFTQIHYRVAGLVQSYWSGLFSRSLGKPITVSGD